MTDIDRCPAAISDLYALRMGVEEFFRDAKSRRNGWSLRDTGIQRPERLDRLILILAVAYLLLVGIGRVATDKCRPPMWATAVSSSTNCGSIHRPPRRHPPCPPISKVGMSHFFC